jgi:hypothetical protein
MCNFERWLIESSVEELYKSTVEAFPNTKKRQFATQPIEISNLYLSPYKGMKTLFMRSLAQNEGREYSPMILFKNVQYDSKSSKSLKLKTETGSISIDQLSRDQDVVLRCNCNDFKWRFNYTDHLDKSLYGRKARKYEAEFNPGSSNPKKMPGMCKHLIKMVEVLSNSGIIRD